MEQRATFSLFNKRDYEMDELELEDEDVPITTLANNSMKLSAPSNNSTFPQQQVTQLHNNPTPSKQLVELKSIPQQSANEEIQYVHKDKKPKIQHDSSQFEQKQKQLNDDSLNGTPLSQKTNEGFGTPLSQKLNLHREFGTLPSQNSKFGTPTPPSQQPKISKEFGTPSSQKPNVHKEFGTPSSQQPKISKDFGTPSQKSNAHKEFATPQTSTSTIDEELKHKKQDTFGLDLNSKKQSPPPSQHFSQHNGQNSPQKAPYSKKQLTPLSQNFSQNNGPSSPLKDPFSSSQMTQMESSQRTTPGRRIPGPISALPSLSEPLSSTQPNPSLQNENNSILVKTKLKLKEKQTKTEEAEFKTPVWIHMLKKLSLPPFGNSTLDYCINDILSGNLDTSRIEVLVVFIKKLNATDIDARATMKDPSGEIEATVHKNVIEKHPNVGIGSVLFLRKVPIFSPTPSSHYLNITNDNIIYCFTSKEFNGFPPEWKQFKKTYHFGSIYRQPDDNNSMDVQSPSNSSIQKNLKSVTSPALNSPLNQAIRASPSVNTPQHTPLSKSHHTPQSVKPSTPHVTAATGTPQLKQHHLLTPTAQQSPSSSLSSSPNVHASHTPLMSKQQAAMSPYSRPPSAASPFATQQLQQNAVSNQLQHSTSQKFPMNQQLHNEVGNQMESAQHMGGGNDEEEDDEDIENLLAQIDESSILQHYAQKNSTEFV